jgi:hypothetical protein
VPASATKAGYVHFIGCNTTPWDFAGKIGTYDRVQERLVVLRSKDLADVPTAVYGHTFSICMPQQQLIPPLIAYSPFYFTNEYSLAFLSHMSRRQNLAMGNEELRSIRPISFAQDWVDQRLATPTDFVGLEQT